ncbi:MAG TPA: DUF6290 family protein [Victivallales bacterium]|jgi:predicted DNA binding CopG/RHH family protein|nr:DUF6290 family protein [Victivallales bacterium]|tara:strand:+ start:5208 stop:5381 length:174 start_codon:yes stop_codon:yes gene_type:complete
MNIFKKQKTTSKNSKTVSISLRFDVEDLKIIKEKAKVEGLPYQTYIKSIIHKKINDK